MALAIVGNLLFVPLDLLAVRLLRRGAPGAWAAPGLPLLVLPVLHLVAAIPGFDAVFFLMQMLCWWGLVHVPLVVLAGLGPRPGPVLLAVAAAVVGVDAFVVEPRWLEISRARLPFAAAGPDGRPLRIALVADLQTDRVGAWEERVFAELRAAAPDLVLFAGDYVQLDDRAARAAEMAKLRALVATLAPPLGGFAVEGDVDAADWTEIFAGTAITPLTDTRTVTVGPLTLTGLAIADTRRRDLDLPRVPGPHVVLGHAPDFVLGAGRRDLNLAGHTHGGQVQLPGFGPLLTLSDVPRAWAGGGATDLGDGDGLYVSRGLGMERRHAPRLRFFCRPELVFLESDVATGSYLP